MKTIGIYADTYNGKIGQTLPYMQFFSQFGYVRLISTLDKLDNIVNEVDMLVTPGGADLTSSLYGKAPGAMDGRANQHYEYLDSILLSEFIKAKKPIVGICRGMQSINSFLGGTLNQHIVGHNQSDERSITKQKLQFTDSEEQYYINSMHHQSVETLGKGLRLVAYSQQFRGCYSKEDIKMTWRTYDSKTGFVSDRDEVPVTVEAFIGENYPILGVQWHPEEFNCEFTVKEIKKLLK